MNTKVQWSSWSEMNRPKSPVSNPAVIGLKGPGFISTPPTGEHTGIPMRSSSKASKSHIELCYYLFYVKGLKMIQFALLIALLEVYLRS